MDESIDNDSLLLNSKYACNINNDMIHNSIETSVEIEPIIDNDQPDNKNIFNDKISNKLISRFNRKNEHKKLNIKPKKILNKTHDHI